MMDDLDKIIRSVIDIDLFNQEVAREKEEAAELLATRKAVLNALKGVDRFDGLADRG
jgi:hypothetical protein